MHSSEQNGIKSPTKEEWAKLYENASTNYEWLLPILEFPKCKTLEIGCGSGLLSKRLIELGYDACTNDINGVESISHRVFDVLGKWPLEKYDIIFSCGLLEHFTDEEIVKILIECHNHAKTVISMVPNADCEGYWRWRNECEKNGTWMYGDERTFKSLEKQYKSAGFDKVDISYCGNDFGGNNYLSVTIATIE